jgi:LSD1 subclass zinc finger protein
MAQDNRLRALTCPNCGASIDFPTGARTVKCKYCNTVVERPQETPPPAQTPPIVIRSEAYRASTPTFTVTTARRRSGVSGCFGVAVTLGGVLIALVIAGIAFLPQLGQGSLSNLVATAGVRLPTNLYITGDAHLIPAASDAPPDVAVLTRNRDDSSIAVAVLDGAQPDLRWRGARMADDDYSAPILANGDLVYTVSKTRLLALKRADGTTAWEASLTDELQSSCDTCFRLLAGQVVALTKDGTLQAIDAQSGKRAWTARAKNVPNDLLAINGQPAFLDGEGGDWAVNLFDPTTGKARTLTPTCESDVTTESLNFTSLVVAREDSPSFYVAFGTFQTCLQKWDVTTGKMTWQAKLEDSLSTYHTYPLLTDKDLYLSNDGNVLAVGTDKGESRSLADEADYDLVPLAVQDNVLLVRAKRTRGTTQYEIWGLDPQTGQHLWEHSLEQAAPLDPPDESSGLISEGDSVWTWHVTSAGLIVLQIHSAPHQVILETLNVETGVSSGQKTVALNFDTPFLGPPQVFGWTPDAVWLVVEDTVLGVDASAGKIFYRWP